MQVQLEAVREMRTEQRDAERAEERNASRGEPQRRLLRGYLHKTSNGLCGIKGYASLIAGGEMDGGDAARWAAKIIREVERMEEIFRSVGDLSDCAMGAAAEPSDLRMTVAKAAARAASRRCGLSVEVGWLPEGELLLPAADLGMVLDELLDNAADSGDEAGRPVTVRICGMVGLGGRTALIVEDDAAGIAPELLPQAADPFVTTRDGHLGIGLARIDTLLDMYGLQWELKSEPDTGTAFTCEVGTAASSDRAMDPLKRKAADG